MPFRDFDAGRKARQPLSFTFAGKPWLLPASPPATKVVAFLNYDRRTGTGDQARVLVEDLFGGVLEELRTAGEELIAQGEEGLDWETLNQIESWALGHWGLGPGLPEDWTVEFRLKQLAGTALGLLGAMKDGDAPPDVVAAITRIAALAEEPEQPQDGTDPKSTPAPSPAGGAS
jgi:hypothetical protein